MPASLFRESKAGLDDPQLRSLLRDLCNQSTVETLDVTGGASGTAFTAAHNLGRIPAGFKYHSGNKAGVVYADSTDRAAWTSIIVQLKCDLATWSGKIDLF